MSDCAGMSSAQTASAPNSSAAVSCENVSPRVTRPSAGRRAARANRSRPIEGSRATLEWRHDIGRTRPNLGRAANLTQILDVRSSGVRANDTRTDRRQPRERCRISRRCWALRIYNECVRGLRYMRVRGRNRQRGSTAIEFALVFPVFFTLIACALEGGRFVVSRMMLTYAVSVGARAATLKNASTTSVQNAVVNAAPMLHLTTTQVEITSGGATATLPLAVGTAGNGLGGRHRYHPQISVQVDHPRQDLPLFHPQLVGQSDHDDTMKQHRNENRDSRRPDSGTITIIAIAMLTALMAMAGLAVDLGFLYTRSRMMYAVADSAVAVGMKDLMAGKPPPSITTGHHQHRGTVWCGRTRSPRRRDSRPLR